MAILFWFVLKSPSVFRKTRIKLQQRREDLYIHCRYVWYIAFAINPFLTQKQKKMFLENFDGRNFRAMIRKNECCVDNSPKSVIENSLTTLRIHKLIHYQHFPYKQFLRKKSQEVLENSGQFQKILGNSSNFSKILQNPRKAKEILENHRKSQEVLGNLENSRESQKILGNSMKSQKILGSLVNPKNSRKSQEIIGNSRKCQDILEHSRKSWEISPGFSRISKDFQGFPRIF